MSNKQFAVVVLLIVFFGSALTYESYRQTQADEAIAAKLNPPPEPYGLGPDKGLVP